MKLTRLRKLTIVVALFTLPIKGFCWGMLGHRIIGEVAESHLTPKARAAVLKILGSESMAMASNWADFVKSDSSYDYLDTWHYVNIPAGKSWEEVKTILEKDTAINAYNRINFLTKELKHGRINAETKKMYLRILIHLVGDIHQPLHVGRLEDRGGNRIKVQWFNAAYNLHQVWDNVLINFQHLSYTEYAKAVNHVTPAQKIALQKESIAQWFYQSYQVAEKIYGDITEPEQKLDYKYNYKYLAVLDKQLLLGGVRLAGLLNDIFK